MERSAEPEGIGYLNKYKYYVNLNGVMVCTESKKFSPTVSLL